MVEKEVDDELLSVATERGTTIRADLGARPLSSIPRPSKVGENDGG